jgi:hypothetical protein
MGIPIVGNMKYPEPISLIEAPVTLREAFSQLDPALQHICSNITFPHDDGLQLIKSIKSKKSSLYGSSDASLKQGRASHAW